MNLNDGSTPRKQNDGDSSTDLGGVPRKPRNGKMPCAAFLAEVVRYDLQATGVSQKKLAKRYGLGIDQPVISAAADKDIVSGRLYAGILAYRFKGSEAFLKSEARRWRETKQVSPWTEVEERWEAINAPKPAVSLAQAVTVPANATIVIRPRFPNLEQLWKDHGPALGTERAVNIARAGLWPDDGGENSLAWVDRIRVLDAKLAEALAGVT